MDFKPVTSCKAFTALSGAVSVFHAFVVITTFNHHLYLCLVPESMLLTLKSSRYEGLLLLYGLESNTESSLQTPQEA